MGLRERYEPGTFCWADLATTDAAGALAFYGELFGWEGEDNPAGGSATYTMLLKDGDYVCALYEMDEGQKRSGMPPFWLSYVSVQSADETAARASEYGGTILAGAFDVMDAGRMALVADPVGATLALWEPWGHIGARRVNDPGCMSWNELQTRDSGIAREFYAALFGWQMQPIEQDGRVVYTSFTNAGTVNGGIMPMADGQGEVASYWMPYFVVASCEETVARARELGGEVLAGPMQPGGGIIAVIRDPQGAAFAVFEGETDD
jgi:uncharacterized protein